MKAIPVPVVSDVLSIPYIVDGDTLWAVRHRVIGEHDNQLVVIHDKTGGTKVRLHDGAFGLNTPEKSKDPSGWAAARLDVEEWIESAISVGERIQLFDYGNGKRDSFGRLLGDIVADSKSLIAHMRAEGWPAYKE